MRDEPDPPRKVYAFKPKDDFAKANVPASLASDAPTSVHEHLELAAGALKPMGEAKPASKPNDVHAMLQQTIERDKAAGLYDVKPGVDTRQVRRRYTFWYPILTLDLLLEAMVLWHINDIGLGTVLAVVIGAVINGAMIWAVWIIGT